MRTRIRPYEPTSDREAAFHLWDAALGDTWPLFPENFYARIDPQAEQHLVAEHGGKLAGLIAISRDDQESGSIFALVVSPVYRSQGIEGMLLAAATEHLRSLGATTLRFGSGQSYFWPGVPNDHPDTIQLLKEHGWRVTDQVTDMVSDLATARVPEDIVQRIAASGAHLRLATAGDEPAILRFEEQNCPQWLGVAASNIKQQAFANILLAELYGILVGTTFLTPAGSPTLLWRRMLGEECAAYGALGVSEAVRGRYIGYALAVRAAEILKARGAETVFLGWVFSTEWYGRLGYQAWKTYQQISKELS